MDINSGEILWSTNIYNQIDKKKKKLGYVKDFVISENIILVFTSNGYFISVNYKNGKLISFKKPIRKGFISKPIFVDGFIYALGSNNKLLKLE